MAEMGINIIALLKFSNEIDDITLSQILWGGENEYTSYD